MWKQLALIKTILSFPTAFTLKNLFCIHQKERKEGLDGTTNTHAWKKTHTANFGLVAASNQSQSFRVHRHTWKLPRCTHISEGYESAHTQLEASTVHSHIWKRLNGAQGEHHLQKLTKLWNSTFLREYHTVRSQSRTKKGKRKGNGVQMEEEANVVRDRGNEFFLPTDKVGGGGDSGQNVQQYPPSSLPVPSPA